MSKYYNIAYLFILSTILVNSQTINHKFEHFSVDQGLSQSTILCIVQDSRGFIWLGTTDGLNKYDGYNFIVYKHDPNDSTSLSSNRIYSICEDSSGYLWVGTYGGGLNRFDLESEQFTHYTNNPDDPTSLSDNEILSIYEDNSGVLWIGTDGGGLNKLLPTGRQDVPGDNGESPAAFIHYKNKYDDSLSISSNRIYSIYEDNFGDLWIGTMGGGLNKFDRENQKFTHYTNNPDDPTSLSANGVYSIYEDNSGILWIGTDSGGINKLVPGDHEESSPVFIHYKNNPDNPTSLSANRVYSIYEDNSGDLWIGTVGGGLNKFDREKEQFLHYKHDARNVSSLSSDGVFSIYEDITGVIWIGTYDGGLNKFDREKEQFIHYFNDPNDPTSISDNTVFSIFEDSIGDLWIGTDGGGLNRFDIEKKQFTHYTNNSNDPTSLSNNEVLSIYEDNTGILWIGTDGGGLNKFDREKEQFTNYTHSPNDSTSLNNNEVFSICEDKFGALWIGTDGGGLNKFDKAKEQFTHYIHDPADSTSLSANRVFSIFEDNSGILWIGTDSGGLNKFDRAKEQFTHYTYNPTDPTSLSNNGVLSIYEDNSGVLWIGTYGGGLNKFDREKNQFTNYRETDGLPNEVIFGILEDEHENLWLSTNKGISKFNPITGLFRNYDVRDGLQSNEFNQGAYHQSKSGNMFFGGINGITKFHPDSVKDNPHIPPIVITDFQLFNKPVLIGIDTSNNRSILKKSITETEEIELFYDDNVISFEFAALDFHIPEKNKYAFIMEGFDRDWTYTDANRRFVTYTNLDPGVYTFRVKGSNNDGVWNEKGTALKIIITPPWWATWWAYTLYGLFAVVLFSTSTRFYLNRQRLRHQLELELEHSEKLEEVNQMKSRFFANISHEFRTPLTLILGPTESIIKDTSKEEIKKKAGTIKRNANRLLNLINQLLDLSKLEAGKLKLKASCGNIVSFVKGIAMSFESVGERRDILLKMKTTNNEIEVYFDKEKMEKILTNLFSNAFKFTPEGGKITVVINERDDKFVEIKVKDTGIGIPEKELPKLFDRFYQVDSSHTREREGTGIGLALTKELVELHRGSIKVESKEGKWTEVTVTLPLGKEHLLPDEIVEADESPDEKKILVEEEDTLTSLQLEKPLPEDFDKDKTIILVVEDNADVREFIKESLEGEYQVEEAVNGEQGVRKAESIIPDLIVSDIMMPKMDGYDLTKKLKNDEKTSHIPIILLTAKTEQESKLEGLATGADDYLVKPFDTEELLIRIKNIINTRRKLHKKFSKGEYILPRGEEKKLRSIDEHFMNKVIEVIEQHISEEEFSIEEFGNEVGMSRSQLHRKLKALSGKSASRYIRSVRLTRAKTMIIDQKGNISEIAYSVGFSSPAYFTKCFKDEYGYPPSDLVS